MQYAALFTPADEGGFVVTFPEVPEAITQGDDEREALEMAQDALLTLFAWMIRNGKEIPAPRKHSGRQYRSVELPVMETMKVELYQAFRKSGLTKSELARQLGIPKTTVDRLFDFKNHTRLDHMAAAFHALGKHLSIEVRDAA